MAMADLSISYEREQVVDFTMPFLDLGKLNFIKLITYVKFQGTYDLRAHI